MNGEVSRSPQSALSRRRLLQALAAAGITGPLALELAAQSRGRVTAEMLKSTAATVGQEYSAERLAVIEKALQRNLDQFQIVRELAIGDEVEPAPMFTAGTPAIAGPRGREGR